MKNTIVSLFLCALPLSKPKRSCYLHEILPDSPERRP